MTHFHCIRCRQRVRIEYHARRAWCPSCGQHMQLGKGRQTRPAPQYAGHPRTEPPPPIHPRELEAIP